MRNDKFSIIFRANGSWETDMNRCVFLPNHENLTLFEEPPRQGLSLGTACREFLHFFVADPLQGRPFRGGGTNAMRWCLARLYYFTRTGNRLGRSEQYLIIVLSSGLPHQNKYQFINHEDKNAVFHITWAIHLRVIVPDKI